MDAAISGTFDGIFTNTGQACASGSRLLLHDDIYDQFVERFVALVDEVVIGPGLEPETDLAPVASKQQFEKVARYIDLGKEEGATVLHEGTIPAALDGGYYVPPVVFGDVTMDMQIAKDEIFGPVLQVFRFDALTEAIEIANDTEYGLTGAVWTTDMGVANRVARALEAGIVYVNNYRNGTFLGAPFGGTKKSGFGRKLGFRETLFEFTQSKTIRTAIRPAAELDDPYA